MDLTANLLDDVLCEVLSYIPLPEKFKLAAVNRKFKRCIAIVLRKPHTLVLNRAAHLVNGHTINIAMWPRTVQLLLQKTRFNRIQIQDRFESEYVTSINLWNEILTILRKSERSNKLTHFEFNGRCKAVVLERFLEACPRLWSVELGMCLVPKNIGFKIPQTLSVNLAQALNNQPLAELTLKIREYQQNDVVALFNAIKPNVLQKINLTLRHMTVDLGHLMQELAGGAWAALREIKLTCVRSTFTNVDQFCALVPNLPHLIHCCFLLFDKEVILEELVGTAVALLNDNDRANPLQVEFLSRHRARRTGCQVIPFLQQVCDIHMGIQVRFCTDRQPHYTEKLDMNMELVQGNVTLATRVSGEYQCLDPDCIDCHSFYPIVLNELMSEVDMEENAHLDGYIVDRCRIDTLVEHINWWSQMWWEEHEIQALTAIHHAHINHEEVVITLENGNGVQFEITVDCEPCFNTACVACMDI